MKEILIIFGGVVCLEMIIFANTIRDETVHQIALFCVMLIVTLGLFVLNRRETG